MVTINCKVCGKECKRKPSRVGFYCSHPCYWKNKVGKVAWNKGLRLGKNPEHSLRMTGRKQSEETIRKRVLKITGKKRTQETIDKVSGKNHWNWIEDRNSVMEKHRLRGTQEWKIWRESVFERDNYTCQECGITNVYLEPHHIVPIRSDCNKVFELTNGITLCRPCHQKTVWKESDYIEKYTQLVAAQ